MEGKIVNDLDKYREEEQRWVTKIYSKAYRLISIVYVIGLASFGLTYLSTPFEAILTMIYKILLFPFLFQFELGDGTPDIFGGLILVLIAIIMQFINGMIRNLFIKKLSDYYLFLPMMFNLGISIWYIGNNFEPETWWGTLLVWASYAVKGFLILVIVPGFCVGLMDEGAKAPKEDLKFENKISKSFMNTLNKDRYVNYAIGVTIYSLKEGEKEVRYSRYEKGIFSLFNLPGEGYIQKINGEHIESYVDAVKILEEVNLGDELTFLIKHNNQIEKFNIRIIDTDLYESYVAKVGSGFASIFTKYAYEDIAVGLDTNVLLLEPAILYELVKVKPVYISMKVFEELDKKKNHDELGFIARKAMAAIEDMQTQNVQFVILEYDRKVSRDLSPDEVIVNTYKEWNANNPTQIIFFSNDRGARILGRAAGLVVSDVF